MSYSSIASIHAIILVSRRKTLITSNIEIVTVSTKSDIRIPIWPMAWDEDCDAVLAVIGTAFLIVAPMAIWSETVQQILQTNRQSRTISGNERKKQIVLIGWFALLFVGLISAWINEVFVNMYSVEQFRFCSAGGHMPKISSPSSLSLLDRQNPGESFNDTIWDTFLVPSISQGHPLTCIYPCFSAPGFRQAGDIRAIPSKGTWAATSNYSDASAGWALMLASIILTAISFAATVTHYTLRRTGCLNCGRGGRQDSEEALVAVPTEVSMEESDVDTQDIATNEPALDDSQDIAINQPASVNSRAGGPPRGSLWWLLDCGAKGLAISSFLIFVAWIEYTIQPFPYTENFSDIGQWGQVVTITLVLLFAAYDNWGEFIGAIRKSPGAAYRWLDEFNQASSHPAPITRRAATPVLPPLNFNPPSP